MKSKRVVQLIVDDQVLSDAIDDQVEQLVLLVEKQGNGEVSNLLFRKCVR